MAIRKKKDCPDCSIRPVVFNSRATAIIIEEQNRLKKLRRNLSERTWDRVVNKIIVEWGAWKDHQSSQSK